MNILIWLGCGLVSIPLWFGTIKFAGCVVVDARNYDFTARSWYAWCLLFLVGGFVTCAIGLLFCAITGGLCVVDIVENALPDDFWKEPMFKKRRKK